MKLIVIVLCLLSERFLVHAISHTRFQWFNRFAEQISTRFSKFSPWLVFALVVIPICLVVFTVFYAIKGGLYGLFGFLLSVAIVYYCLGPNNPFYPIRTSDHSDRDQIECYFVSVNNQLFSVLFWYMLLGPVGAVFYRLSSLTQSIPSLKPVALMVTDCLDWIPARMTALFYLLVGNFQSGVKDYFKLFFDLPNNNHALLRVCGIKAIGQMLEPEPYMLQAEAIVEHALILFLVMVAILTFNSWF